jgi:hypothetical protein
MATVREWMRRLWGMIRRHPRDRDLEEELKLHLELAAEDIRKHSGSSIGSFDAQRMARIQVGGVAQTMDALRDQRGLPWLDDVARDVRHGLRSMRRSPAHSSRTVDAGAGDWRKHGNVQRRQRRSAAAASVSIPGAVDDVVDRGARTGRIAPRQTGGRSPQAR